MEAQPAPDLPYMTACQHIPGKFGNSQIEPSAFHSLLNRNLTRPAAESTQPATSTYHPDPSSTQQAARLDKTSGSNVVSSYQKHLLKSSFPGKNSAVAKYKDDQLLSNPGGDYYYMDQKKILKNPDAQKSFWGRIGKNIADAISNVKNFVGDLLLCSRVHYRDKNDQIQEVKRRGLVGSVADFFKDVGSALSFGKYRPDGEKEPQGVAQRIGFFFNKMKEAVCGDILQGVTASIIHMGEDLLFAGWNLFETLPDATIGNFEAGRKLTTKIFDNGQVVLDYITDILPAGDAWVRVHSADLKKGEIPILHNYNAPEYEPVDVTRKFVRNTPFRKKIETIGSVAMDILSLKFLRRMWSSDSEHHN